MFTELLKRPDTDAMRILVWSEGPVTPFETFMCALLASHGRAARFLWEHMIFIMESGEAALASSRSVGNGLQIIEAGNSWLIYFTESTCFYVCEQGFEQFGDKPEVQIQTSIFRMSKYKVLEQAL